MAPVWLAALFTDRNNSSWRSDKQVVGMMTVITVSEDTLMLTDADG
jgi:hypothetical protein